MTDKEYVLSFYPDASVCYDEELFVIVYNHHMPFTGKETEEAAWLEIRELIDRQLIRKLEA